jgi:hypothetical protein
MVGKISCSQITEQLIPARNIKFNNKDRFRYCRILSAGFTEIQMRSETCYMYLAMQEAEIQKIS